MMQQSRATQCGMWGIGALALSAMLAGTVLSADARANRSDRESFMQEQRQGGQAEYKKITGTVKRMKNVGLKGRDQENLVVQLQTKQGRKKIVDLGNAENLQDFDIRKGDRVTAWGRSINIGDKRVFMAHKLRANDETIDIERHRMPRQQSGGQASMNTNQRDQMAQELQDDY